MKAKMTLEVQFDQGVSALKEALTAVGDDATIEPVTEWRGYGTMERKEFVGLRFTWQGDVSTGVRRS